MFETERELQEKLYEKFLEDLFNDLANVIKKFNRNITQNEIHLTIDRIKVVTSEMFLSGFYNERDYMLTLFGAIAPNSAFEDFSHYIKNNIPSIHAFYEADHGINDFIGKWVITKRNHFNILSGTIVKITGESFMGYDIASEDGRKVFCIGYEI